MSLRDVFDAAGIELSSRQEEQFMIYLDFLLEYNRHTNLTAIANRQDIFEKHFLDSVLFLKAYEPRDGEAILDVGSGAGFPGIPLIIMRPDLNLSLLDSLNKRLEFLGQLCERLGVKAYLLHRRAEDAGHDNWYREKYPTVTARAVARLPVLLEYCMPFVQPGGRFIALKGPELEKEIAESQNALDKLKGEIESTKNFTLPSGEGRSILTVKKTEAMAGPYPRSPKAIKKKPL